jgi:plasmid stabilization system protein ParE
MTFDFHPDALDEYHSAAAWYAEQRVLLGVEYVQAVEAAIAAIMSDPGRFQPVGDGIRIFRMKRFPDYLFYRFNETGQHVRIVAVMHQRRKPDYWRERL